MRNGPQAPVPTGLDTPAAADDPIRSAYADDPDFAAVLRAFVEGLPELRETLSSALRDSDFDRLRSEAHRLKGAAGGYGFPGLTAAAARLEAACRTGGPVGIVVGLDELFAYIGRIAS